MYGLTEKTAIITDGLGGIGRGIVVQDEGERVLEELTAGRPALYLERGIAHIASAGQIVATTVARFGTLHALVNNARASRQAPILVATQEMWDLSRGTGLLAIFNLMRAAHPELGTVKGAIVDLASGAALKGQPTQTAYAAAKEAIRAISRVAANEWAADGKRVNVVSPLALTPGIKAWSKSDPEQYGQVLRGIPLGGLGHPAHDIAPVVAFLVSEAARYITGQTLLVDGDSIMLH